MNKYAVLLACTGLLIFSCTNNPEKADTAPETVKKNFFPVADFLKGEIAYVDSFPQSIMRYTTSNGKTDSGFITTAVFHQLAQEFLQPGLDSASFEKRFDENSFLDQSTKLLTFTYSTKDTSKGLERVDVLASPELGPDKVKSIYMESVSGDKDASVLKKFYWQSRHQFNIIHIYQPDKQAPSISQLKCVWGDGN